MQACLPKAGLLGSSLKFRFGNSDLGLTFSELGIFRPSKQKVPAGAGTHFFTKESYHTSDRLVKCQNKLPLSKRRRRGTWNRGGFPSSLLLFLVSSFSLLVSLPVSTF